MIGRRHFLRDESGAGAAEFALVVLLFVVLIFGIIDFGRALWEWNSAAKATQLGVRLAVVTDMVAGGLQTYDGLADAGGNGLPVPIGAIAPNPVVCTQSGCNGYDPKNDAAFDAVVARMQQVYSRIQPENVIVEYRHIGLGFAGNPFGPDIVPLVTVRLTGMNFDFITPGLSGMASIPMPDFSATLTGEDSET